MLTGLLTFLSLVTCSFRYLHIVYSVELLKSLAEGFIFDGMFFAEFGECHDIIVVTLCLSSIPPRLRHGSDDTSGDGDDDDNDNCS